MSLMNLMSVTLVLLVLGAIAALFFGTRASDAADLSYPVFATAHQSVTAVPDAMDDISAPHDIVSE